jgi:hypothetical protein
LDEQSAELITPRVGIPQTPDMETLFSVQRIYRSRIGPTPDGKVDVSFDLTIAPGLYEQIGIQATIADRGDDGRQREIDLEGVSVDPQSLGIAVPDVRLSPTLCSSQSEFVSCTTLLLPEAPQAS